MRYIMVLPIAIAFLMVGGCQYFANDQRFEGTWSHTIPWKNGRQRSLIIRGIRDDEDNLTFEFLRQYYSYKPVFTEYSFDKNNIVINFKLVTYSKDQLSKHQLKYILRRERDTLQGQLFQSWKEPVTVTLKKLKETDAIKALAELAEERNLRSAASGKRFKKYSRDKKKLKQNIKKLEDQLSKSQDEVTRLKEKTDSLKDKIKDLGREPNSLKKETSPNVQQQIVK